MSDPRTHRQRALTRRDLLRAGGALVGLTTAAGLLGACQQPAPPAAQPTAAPAAKPTTAPAAAAPTAQPTAAAAKPQPAPTTAPAAAPAAKPKAGGKAVIGIGSTPATLDPHTNSDAEAGLVYLHIYDILYRFDEQGARNPLLAESVKAEADRTTWTVSLRKGVKFQDGTPFNARAVAASFMRHLDPNAKRDAAILAALKSAEAVDDSTVKFAMKSPYGPFVNMLAHYTTSVVSPAAAEKYGEDLTNHPTGTGAFKFKEWVQGDRIVLQANPDYWKGAPKLDEVTFRTVKDDTTRILMVESGDLDAAVRVPPTEVERIRQNSNLRLLANEAQRAMYFQINVARKPFDDVRVRQALNHAVDKEGIVKNVLKGTARVVDSPIGPKVWGYTPVGKYEYNPDKARQLLKEAGAEGIPVKMWTSQGREVFDRQVAEVIQGQLQAVGLKAELQVFGDWPAFLDALLKNEHDLALRGWGFGDGDANKALPDLLHSRFAGKVWNQGNYKNPKLDDLLDKGRETVDEAERKKIYAEAQKLVFDEAPWIFLHSNNSYVVVRKELQGVLLPADDKLDLRTAYREA